MGEEYKDSKLDDNELFELLVKVGREVEDSLDKGYRKHKGG